MSVELYKSEKWVLLLTFAVKHKRLNTRMVSRLGGIFTGLSDYVLETGGVVYGYVLDESFAAIHIRAENIET